MTTQPRQFPSPVRELVYYQHRRDQSRLVIFDGTSYRQGDRALPSEDFRRQDYIQVNHLRRHAGREGEYPWDLWHRWAIEDGVPSDLAGLGRTVIRTSDQQGWHADLQAECGWQDSGAAMLKLARNDPNQARQRWRYLLSLSSRDSELDA